MFYLDGQPKLLIELTIAQVHAVERQAEAAGLEISAYIGALIDAAGRADEREEQDPQVGLRGDYIGETANTFGVPVPGSYSYTRSYAWNGSGYIPIPPQRIEIAHSWHVAWPLPVDDDEEDPGQVGPP